MAELQVLRTPAASSYLNYWQAYAYYHLYFRVHASQPAQAESYLQSGIAALEAVAAPNSEHLALLSLLQGLNLEYSTFVLLPVRAGIAQRNAEKALALHARNLRACYALAIHDYYTPKIYGGGQLAQRYFRRAVALPDKSDRNPYAPDWGKADAYWYLARTFAAAGQPDSVRHYAQQGALRYPWHQGLVNLAKKP
ncbi:hypothetical protein E5K00_13870 [Hymenobacter aquaticus]|uniref:Tetratricopeptide repeat protein n=1 Tax=Hymenobacter aquaticus TaxID=1867101 RepID=A0A4Z0PY46_9BACT|nr:hypothetical protein E5K00_13870 [Hymenobacter aquaticus]